MRPLSQLLFTLAAAALVSAAVAAAAVYVVIFHDLPHIYDLRDYRPNLITRVLAEDGQEIAKLAKERRIVVPIERIPTYLVQAFIAAEDDAFYEHEGLDYLSILRAAWANLRAGGVTQGGSTITQQVAKTFLLSSERTLIRKLKDMVLARRIERYLQKNEILYLYLNQIYLGSGGYGVEAAARTYFDKSVSDLSLAESALIAGLVPAPSRYTPFKGPDLARGRQRFVLRRMLEQNFITPEEHDRALEEELVFAEQLPSDTPGAVAYFAEEVRRYLVARYGEEEVLTGGLTVRTTMDLDAQLAAYHAVRRGLRNHDRRSGYRGPIRVAPEEEWPQVVAQLAERNAEVDERVGSVIEALVVEVDDAAQQLHLALGPERKTTLVLEDVQWARKPDPDWDGSIPRIKRVGQALRKGYLVRLERTGEARPEDGKPDPETGRVEPVPTYTLFQEPLAEGALFAMEIETGKLQALVGGYSFGRSQFDRAVQMRRQPGSAFKPIIYSTAITRGYTPASIVYDTPIVWEDTESGLVWKPGNYSEKFYGPIPLRQALAKSRNIATIKILQDIGIPPVLKMARALGIEGELTPNLGLALGNSEVTLAELVRAFATFASGGRRVEPVFILEIRDREDQRLEENVRLLDALAVAREGEDAEAEEARDAETEAPLEEVEELPAEQPETNGDREPEPLPPGYSLDPVTAYLMTDLLRAVVQEGTGFRARALDRPTAGKTGTTNDLHDAWYLGFCPFVVTGVWVGYDSAHSLGKNETGSRAASPIFVDYARESWRHLPRRDFSIPDGIEFARIDPATGLRACPGDEKAIFQPFREGTSPLETAPCDERNGGFVRAPRMD